MDLDGDGHLDILSGSWPGELFFFRGGPGRTFAAPEMIKDKEGHIINIGGGIKKSADGSITINGNAEFEETPEGWFVKYQGQRLKSTAEKPIYVSGTASAVHASDWDGDGDLDLIVGDISGNVFLVRNEGTPKAFAFGKEVPLEVNGESIRLNHGDAGPIAADWDGDGDLDLLVGDGEGSVSFFRNTGTRTVPVLTAPEVLVPPGKIEYSDKAPKTPCRGVRSKLCVADWNGDGLLDLLLGDIATQSPDLPVPTAEAKAEQEKARAELKPLEARYRELIKKIFGESRVKSDDEIKKVQEELKQLQTKMEEVRLKIPPEYEDHGWVWYFQRKSAGK